MHKLNALLATLVIMALSGCNSMDALTPKVDVGGGTFRSPPLNQNDLDSMSQQNAYVPPQPTASVESSPLGSPASQEDFSGSTDGTEMAQGDTDYTDPPGSLEAQAGRLQQTEAPARSQSQVHSRAQEQTEAQPQESRINRAAPIDATAIDEPRAAAARDAGPANETKGPLSAPEQAQQTAEPQKQAAIAPAASAGTIRFLPIIGAPVEAVTPLSKQLGAEARSHGLTIKGASDPTSQHILKGYFSAFKDSGKTTIIYVWDVLDGSGNRLHRIQGQDTVAASAPDLWSIVPAQTMQAIATKTIGEYLDWRASQPG